MSNLIDQFDENYDGGIGLNDSIIDLIETSKVDTPELRQVSDEAVFAVAERSLVASASFPKDVQHFNAIREVTNFLTLSTKGAVSEAVNKHKDLLPVNHPDSTAAHEFSTSELRELRSEWIASDPRIEDDSVRSIVAATYASNPYSLEYYYNLVRLTSLADQVPSDLRLAPLVAFGDPYAGKNSFWHRKMRAEAQRRDDEGQFAEMGGGARLYVRLPAGNIISVVGKVAGIPENDPNGIDLEILDVDSIDPGVYTVPLDKVKFFKAIIPEEGISKKSPVGPGLNVEYVEIQDLVRKDLPTSWYEADSGTTVSSLGNTVAADENYATGDGYRVSLYRGLSEGLEKRVDEAKEKFGSLVVNTKGTDLLESNKPVYELISTKRGQEEVVGYAQDWATVQALAKAEDDNYPSAENEPIEKTPEPQKPAPTPEPQKPAPTPEPSEAPPAPAPETTEVEPDLSKEEADDLVPIVSNPFTETPGGWFGFTGEMLKESTPELAISQSVYGYPNVFLKKDSEYSVVAPSSLSYWLPESLSPRESGLDESMLQPQNFWVVQAGTDSIGVATNWQDVERVIQAYEAVEDLPVVDEKQKKVGRTSKVDLLSLLEDRYKLLDAENQEVKDFLEKEKAKPIWNVSYKRDKTTNEILETYDVGGYEAGLGIEGPNQGILFKPVFRAIGLLNINRDLLLRKGSPEAIDMWDEMMDYPENFTVGQLATFYFNLTRLPDKSVKKDEQGKKVPVEATYPQQREKIRRAIQALNDYKVPESQYEGLKDKISNYRLVPGSDAGTFLNELNAILAPYREDQSEFGLTFKPKVSVKGSEVIVGDTIVDRDGNFVEVSEVAAATPELDQDPSEVANRIDISVLRGGQSRYLFDIDRDDNIEVYRGTGVLPTKENLKLHEELKLSGGKSGASGTSDSSAVDEEEGIFDDEDDSTNYGDRVSSKATEGKKDPSEVIRPILDRAVNALRRALDAHIVTDKAAYDRAVELVNNKQFYEYAAIAAHTTKINSFESRPRGEFTADIELIESLRDNIKNSSLSFEEKKELLKDLHQITSADAKKMASVFKESAGGFDRSDIEAIKNQTNIVDLINEYTPLSQQSPNDFRGLCVFHEEVTPSMSVKQDEKRFYCFGCKEHGDVFNFIQKKEGLTLPQAVKKLAARIGYTPSVENLTALLISRSRGFKTIPPEAYAPYGTDLIGDEAPSPGLMVKVRQVIENYEIKPDDPSWLAWFMDNHRSLQKEVWDQLIQTWEKPEYAKHIPRVFTNALPMGDGYDGPTNRQLVSIERIWSKGFLPKEFMDYFLKSYPTAKKGWFSKIGTVLKGLEDLHDAEILEYAVANLRDIEKLRVPTDYPGIPTGYRVPVVNKGYELDLEESEAFKNKYLALFPSYLRSKTEGDEFWKDLVDIVAPMTEVGDGSSEGSEESKNRVVRTIAQKIDAQKTRNRLRRIRAYAERLLDAPSSEVNRAGKSVIARFVVDVDILANALKLSRKNIVNRVPAEYDRRVMGIVAGLGGGRSPYSYGSIKGTNQSTRDTIDNLIGLISQEVGAYKAGESEESQIAVDEMFSSNVFAPRMKRFVPPAFTGPALEPLKDMDQFDDVINFLKSKELRVVDLETTGLKDLNDDQIKNDPIQIAVAEMQNLEVRSVKSTYINPESALSQFTLKTIGDGTGKKVTREFLESQPSKYEAMRQFLDTVPQDSILVGHNGFLFDMEVINRTLREAGLPEYQFSGFIDTYGLSNYIMPRWTPESPNAPYKLAEYPIDGKYLTPVPSDTLESLVMYFGLSNNGRHEADADVLSTAEVLVNLLQFAAAGKGDKGRNFDFFTAQNNWSELEYVEAEAKYRGDVEKYKSQVERSEIGLRLKNASLVKTDPNEVIDSIIEALGSKRIDPDFNRSQPLPASNIVSQLPSGSYVFDISSGRIGRSYGSGEDGKVLVEFAASDYLASNRKTLELLSPASLYNMTDALINKDGMVFDYGMSVSHKELGDGVVGHFAGFEGSGVAKVTVGPALYRLPVKELSILKYLGTLIASKDQVQKANNLLKGIKNSETLSGEFIQAVKKTLSAEAYPGNSLTDLIKMLVNAENQKKLVEANKDMPGALQSSQESATSIAVDEKKRTPKLTAKDLENVAIDDTLIKKKMPNIKLTKENKEILKAIAAPAINKGKSKTKNRNNLIIGALAGTGKTTQLETIALQEAAMNPNRRILYTVKGKANQKQAEKRLKDVGNIKASTLNSLAFNVKANEQLVIKYKDQNHGSPFSEQLNPIFAPATVARHFAVQEKYEKSILDRYKAILSLAGDSDIVPNQLVRWAYDGLISWMNSADREFSPSHFTAFNQYMDTAPAWSPGGAGYEPGHPGSRPSGLEDGYVVLKNGETRRGEIKGQMYVYRNAAGRITTALSKAAYETRKRNQKGTGEGASDYDKYTLEDIVSYESKPEANAGFFIDDLIDLAQTFWDNITSPLVPDTMNVSLPVTQDTLVKNWALGNVDITAVEIDDSGRRTSIQGLKDVPDMWQIDEAQDLSPVFIDILLRQQFSYDNGVQIVIVGDVNQAIFQFAGRENAMAEGTLPDNLIDGVAGLTQNYRSEPEVLVPANNLLGVLGSKDKLVAAKKATGKGIIHAPKSLLKKGMTVVTRSNAGILNAAVALSADSKSAEDKTFGSDAVFAILPNLKLRLRDTLEGLRYLEKKSRAEKTIKNSKVAVDLAREGVDFAYAELNRVQDMENPRPEAIAVAENNYKFALTLFNQENDKVSLAERILKDLNKKGMPKKAPYILRGTDVTYESIEQLSKDLAGTNGSLDAADVLLIVKLANKMQFTKDSEGKSIRAMYRNEALDALYELTMKMRLIDDEENFKMPTFVGQAGSLGGEIGYRVEGDQLVIEGTKGSFMLDSNDLFGVYANRFILQSIGFKQELAEWEKDGLSKDEARTRYTEENPGIDESELAKKLYRPFRWVKDLALPEDDMYVEEEVTAVYNALTGKDASAVLVTGHTAKGLEYKSIKGWDDWDPAYYMEQEQEELKAKQEAEAKKKPKTEEELEKEKAEDLRYEEEKELKRQMAFDRTELNLIYVFSTRAMEDLDLGPLHNFLMTDSGLARLRNALAIHEPTDENPPAVDEMYSTPDRSQGEHYDRINDAALSQKQAYLKSLELALKTPIMQRITPFRFATDADIKQEEQETRKEIADLIVNPRRLRTKDENNRMGLLEILDMIRRGGGASVLSEADRQRLYSYLGSSSLGSQGALEVDPTQKIEEAVEELNKRLGID